ncbi:uncharacterized protein [Magallana gigas]|uniref:uncharacterized protein n=1 Tax=Magallana gigas TaxID=29159 RepID=UPI00333E9A3E
MGLRVIWMNTAYIIVNVFVLSVRGHGLENKSAFPKTENFKITEIQFMIAVNATWQGEHGCIAYAFTPALPPGNKWNATQPIKVGGCDKGPFIYNVIPPTDGKSKVSVNVTFFSSDVIDAEPPSCQIPFNGTFLLPSPDGYDDELLPNCFVQDSREETERLFLILRSVSEIPVENFEPVVSHVIALSGIHNKAVGK